MSLGTNAPPGQAASGSGSSGLGTKAPRRHPEARKGQQMKKNTKKLADLKPKKTQKVTGGAKLRVEKARKIAMAQL